MLEPCSEQVAPGRAGDQAGASQAVAVCRVGVDPVQAGREDPLLGRLLDRIAYEIDPLGASLCHHGVHVHADDDVMFHHQHVIVRCQRFRTEIDRVVGVVPEHPPARQQRQADPLGIEHGAAQDALGREQVFRDRADRAAGLVEEQEAMRGRGPGLQLGDAPGQGRLPEMRLDQYRVRASHTGPRILPGVA